MIALFLFLAAAPHPDAGRDDCAKCHASIAVNYAKTGMGRSFSANPVLKSATSGNYRILERSVQRIDPPREVTVEYAIGSGDHAVSYLHRTRDNKLVELPVSFYAEQGGHWGPSPGYDRPDSPGFSRDLAYRCLFCHDAYPALEPGHTDGEGEKIFPSRLPEGIDCERCHGSGTKIVNPARLAPERQLEVCMQCHLETTSLAPWASVTRPTRGVFSYRPGEPLADYISYFDHAPGTGHDEKLELVSEAYRFRQSACFLKSNGRLTCTTCHNPHEQTAVTDAACGNCHQPHTREGSCIECHMPKRQASDAIHIAITDHRIARHPAPQLPLIEQHDGNTPVYTGKIVPYYPAKPRTADAPASEGWRSLYAAGRAQQNVALLEQAFKLAPWETAILQALGAAYYNASRLNDAIRAFREAAERDPEDAMAFSNLGNMLLRAGDSAGAEKAFREAIRLQPEMPQLRENLRRLR